MRFMHLTDAFTVFEVQSIDDRLFFLPSSRLIRIGIICPEIKKIVLLEF